MKIVKYPHAALQTPARKIEVFDEKLKAIAEEMHALMQESNGIGLAANQVGLTLQMFVMKSEILVPELKHNVFINPEIIEASPVEQDYEEGCLSFPQLYLKIKRPEAISLQWQDLNGDLHSDSFSGLSAICIQHEMDHLKGINFIDKIGHVKKAFALKKLKKLNAQKSEK